jgi:single-stranded DNA-binding protein
MHYSNSVFLAGNLVTTPELRQLPGGRDVANAKLAIVSHFLVNNGNEVAERTTTLNLGAYPTLRTAMSLKSSSVVAPC